MGASITAPHAYPEDNSQLKRGTQQASASVAG